MRALLQLGFLVSMAWSAPVAQRKVGPYATIHQLPHPGRISIFVDDRDNSVEDQGVPPTQRPWWVNHNAENLQQGGPNPSLAKIPSTTTTTTIKPSTSHRNKQNVHSTYGGFSTSQLPHRKPDSRHKNHRPIHRGSNNRKPATTSVPQTTKHPLSFTRDVALTGSAHLPRLIKTTVQFSQRPTTNITPTIRPITSTILPVSRKRPVRITTTTSLPPTTDFVTIGQRSTPQTTVITTEVNALRTTAAHITTDKPTTKLNVKSISGVTENSVKMSTVVSSTPITNALTTEVVQTMMPRKALFDSTESSLETPIIDDSYSAIHYAGNHVGKSAANTTLPIELSVMNTEHAVTEKSGQMSTIVSTTPAAVTTVFTTMGPKKTILNGTESSYVIDDSFTAIHYAGSSVVEPDKNITSPVLQKELTVSTHLQTTSTTTIPETSIPVVLSAEKSNGPTTIKEDTTPKTDLIVTDNTQLKTIGFTEQVSHDRPTMTPLTSTNDESRTTMFSTQQQQLETTLHTTTTPSADVKSETKAKIQTTTLNTNEPFTTVQKELSSNESVNSNNNFFVTRSVDRTEIELTVATSQEISEKMSTATSIDVTTKHTNFDLPTGTTTKPTTEPSETSTDTSANLPVVSHITSIKNLTNGSETGVVDFESITVMPDIERSLQPLNASDASTLEPNFTWSTPATLENVTKPFITKPFLEH